MNNDAGHCDLKLREEKITIPSYFDLRGKVAIVTGGGTGIGRAIAEGLAECGANLVLCGRRKEKCEVAGSEIARRTGKETLSVICDVSKQEEVKHLVDVTIERFGHIDILVNNAGITGSGKPILEMKEEDWDSVLDINLKAAFLTSNATVSHMIAQGGGKIINLSSMAALIGFANTSAYSASKGGLVQLTKVMALEWVRHNIQVNALCPGYFETPLSIDFFSTEIGKKIINQNIPMKRLGKVEELKGIAVFLASRASSFMTGSVIVIDGGHTVW